MRLFLTALIFVLWAGQGMAGIKLAAGAAVVCEWYLWGGAVRRAVGRHISLVNHDDLPLARQFGEYRRSVTGGAVAGMPADAARFDVERDERRVSPVPAR